MYIYAEFNIFIQIIFYANILQNYFCISCLIVSNFHKRFLMKYANSAESLFGVISNLKNLSRIEGAVKMTLCFNSFRDLKKPVSV